MLTREQNELLCRVEGGAAMGQIMRRHWLPLCMAEEARIETGRQCERACSAKTW